MKTWILFLILAANCVYGAQDKKPRGCKYCKRVVVAALKASPDYKEAQRTNIHTITRVYEDQNGKKRFRLENGSFYDPLPESQSQAASWKRWSLVRVYPGKTKGSYRLFNVLNQESIEGTLSIQKKAYLNDNLRRTLATINRKDLKVGLDDNSFFSIPTYSHKTLRWWKKNEQILIGDNDDERFPYLLINVSKNGDCCYVGENNYIPAKIELK